MAALDRPGAVPAGPRRPVRAVFCHYTADVCGGSDRSLFDIVTHLPRDRFTPAMILKTGDPLAPEYRARGIEVVELSLVSPRRALEWAKLGRYSLSYGPSVLRVAGVIRRLDADVVHVNTLYNLVGPVAARLAGRPLVWHVREMVEGSRAVAAMLWMVRRLAARAVAISSAVAGTLAGCGDRLRLIPNGIDLSEYEALPAPEAAKAALGIAPESPVVVAIGRLEPWKGQHVLVEAAPAIVARHPGVRILFVGGPAVNKPDYEPGLRARCRELSLNDHVVFTGVRGDVPAILAASDVLALPTATPEPFGRTVVEAMAAGRPVVATAAGGPLDTVVDGETGYLVPPNDPAALAGRINALLDDPPRARTMGAHGRQRAHALYSLDRLARDMAALLEETARPRRIEVFR